MNERAQDRTDDQPGAHRACPLCGATFSEDEERCKGCPMHRNCSVLCCPACGYTFVVESQVANAFAKLWKRRTAR